MKIACSPLLYNKSVPLDTCPEMKKQTREILRIILTVHKIKQGLGILSEINKKNAMPQGPNNVNHISLQQVLLQPPFGKKNKLYNYFWHVFSTDDANLKI